MQWNGQTSAKAMERITCQELPRTVKNCQEMAHIDKLGVMVSHITSCDSNGETGKVKGDRHTCTRWHALQNTAKPCRGHATAMQGLKQWNGCQQW